MERVIKSVAFRSWLFVSPPARRTAWVLFHLLVSCPQRFRPLCSCQQTVAFKQFLRTQLRKCSENWWIFFNFFAIFWFTWALVFSFPSLSLSLCFSFLFGFAFLSLSLSLSLSPSYRLCLTWQLLQTALGVALSVGLAIALTGFVVIYYSTRLTQCFCACVLCIPSVLHHALAIALRGYSRTLRHQE